MSVTIYARVAPSMRPTTTTTLQSIEDIIESVRSGIYEDRIRLIRETKGDDERKALKRDTLPVFYPTVLPSVDTRLGEDSEPTGIVQFDIDKKDNHGLDVNELCTAVMKHHACIYAFRSPSGGLKFGLLTDFARAPGEPIDITKRRFKIAYRLCLQLIQQYCVIRFHDDADANKLRQSCFLSHDPDAFFRADCIPLALNDQCHVPPPAAFTATEADIASVQILLDYIPRDLHYDDRFKVNVCVLKMLGRPGIGLLMNHWEKKERAELEQQLEEALRNAKYGSIYMLQSYAKEYGNYKPSNGGAARRYIQPMPCDYSLRPLSTPAEATASLQAIIRKFVTAKTSHFVKVTTGAGKTRTVLEALSREVVHDAKILFLVPTHDLGDQIIKTYNEIRAADIASADTIRGKLQRPSIVKFHSRKTLCENKEARENLEEFGISIPLRYCLSRCPHQGVCEYTLQFNTTANIRVMTHNEWINEQSAWFNGSRTTDTGSTEPNGNRSPWVPDYIVIDEDILRLGRVQKESTSKRFPSIARIILDVDTGKSLQDAIWKHGEQVILDAAKNTKPATPSLNLPLKQYRHAYLKSREDSQHSEIIARLESYVRSDDPTLLDGMWVEDNAIRWLPLPAPAERYEGIPTLYLDATAHPAVVQRLLPGVQFHSIAVRQHADVQLFQLSNKTITKEWLSGKPENLPNLVDGLIEIAKPYTNVGLITYMQIGDKSDFAASLAEKIGASHHAHFGDLRGLDTMKDVDCLLVVGRHMLLPKDTLDYARALFSCEAESERPIYADLPVRMKDGGTYSLNSMIPKDPWHQVVYEHTSLSETLQAIGRARPVHGPKKDIYIFANENLSINTEVAGFFPFERYFKELAMIVTPEAVERVRDRGFVQLMPKDLMDQLGLSDHQVKGSEKQNRIADELVSNGADWIKATVRFEKGKVAEQTYLVFDIAALERHLDVKGTRIIEVDAVTSDEALTD